MMRDVVQRGTGTAAKVLGREDLGGKTGSTNEHRDAWFSGFGGGIVTTVWVGRDDFKSLGYREYGGKAALPIWIDYMRVALKDRPVTELEPPDGMIKVPSGPAARCCPKAAAATSNGSRPRTWSGWKPPSTTGRRIRHAERGGVRHLLIATATTRGIEAGPKAGFFVNGPWPRFHDADLRYSRAGIEWRDAPCLTPVSMPTSTPSPAPANAATASPMRPPG